jgi:hypothetical protein
MPRPSVRSKVKLGKVFCPTTPLIGQPFGTYFTLGADGRSLEIVD